MTQEAKTPKISVQNLTEYFGTKLILHSVNLDVKPHEVVCLIGASGSGKSTLLRCINRLFSFDYGRVLLDGVDIEGEEMSDNALRKRIGIVFQSYNLFPHMTVLDNITLAPRKVHGIGREEAKNQARDLLGLFDLQDQAESYPDRLSGGQQQRVAIIRAMATNPDVLLLDEVTAALDPELIGGVLKIIRDLKNDGMTMVIVTHEMGFARDVADRVCFLDEGHILEEGDPVKLFTKPEHLRTRQFLQRIIEAGRL
ncbi:MAG: amino acid ABC transporter ATP-binding protein [Chloroflexi bacterium]|nr:amino acid ABC transporter ATP-binding protein [Chloroflexota bacterium]